MATRTALLSSRNINLDTDFSKYIETVSEPGVIEGFELANSKIGVGKAWVPCERTNGETIYALVENFAEVSLDTSGSGYIIISISQSIIDDGSLGNEDGTGIATIEVVNSLPSKNYLELYSLSSGTATDERNMIKKVGELNTAIQSMQGVIDDLDDRVEALETAGAINHLEEMEVLGEKYSISDIMFLQYPPKLGNSFLKMNVGDVDGNKEIHIQRMGNGTASNKVKLKLAKVGSPTTTLFVEVRKGIKVDGTNAYWYGDSGNILASGSVNYSDITTNLTEIEITLDNNFSGEDGELLDVVVYQGATAGTPISNSSNYFVLGYDGTQYSYAYSQVAVNGTSRTRGYYMPYCVSSGLLDKLLSKNDEAISVNVGSTEFEDNTSHGGYSSSTSYKGYDYTYTVVKSGIYTINVSGSFGMADSRSRDMCHIDVKVNGKDVAGYRDGFNSGTQGTYSTSFTNIKLKSGDSLVVHLSGYYNGSNYYAWISGNAFSIVLTSTSLYKDNTINNDIELLPREENIQIGEKLTCTSYGRHSDNNWKSESNDEPLTMDNFFFGSMIDYIKSKGESHSVSISGTTYVCLGYGYVLVSGYTSSSSYDGYVSINGVTVVSISSTSYMSGTGFFFVKPGDTIYSNNGYCTARLYEYY